MLIQFINDLFSDALQLEWSRLFGHLSCAASGESNKIDLRSARLVPFTNSHRAHDLLDRRRPGRQITLENGVIRQLRVYGRNVGLSVVRNDTTTLSELDTYVDAILTRIVVYKVCFCLLLFIIKIPLYHIGCLLYTSRCV